MNKYKKLIEGDFGKTKKYALLNSFLDMVSNFINRIIDFFQNIFKFLKSKFTLKSINKENSSDKEMHNIDRKKLVGDTLKYINVLIEDDKQNNEIKKITLPKKDPEKTIETNKLQEIIKQKDLELENKLIKLGFYDEDQNGKKLGNYGSFMNTTIQNIRDLNIKTKDQNYILNNEYENIKNQLENIIKNNYQEQSENQNESKWQDKVKKDNKKDNNRDNQNNLIYNGL